MQLTVAAPCIAITDMKVKEEQFAASQFKIGLDTRNIRNGSKKTKVGLKNPKSLLLLLLGGGVRRG